MKKIVLPLLSAGLVLAACQKKETVVENVSVEQPLEVVSDTVVVAPVGVSGTFVGELPCADCDGITETLTLKEDGTFERESFYKGSKKEEPVKVSGKYKAEGTKITLEGITDGSSNLYELEGDKLHYLTAEGKKVEGALANQYILTKK